MGLKDSMDYDFLNSYTIPVYTSGAPPPPPPVPAIDPVPDYQSANLLNVVDVAYPPNRYFQPGTGRPTQPRRAPKRLAEDSVGAQTPPNKAASKEPVVTFFTEMVKGYPEDLRRLVHAFHCEMCDMKMNSLRSAADHYQSKAHDRHINTWLQQNFTDKGLTVPEVRRTLKKSSNSGAPTGPDAFHCELCDLKLTSLTHATQHYSGRKHKLVASNVSKPSGAGYYRTDGKWVRTGTKLTPAADPDGRFGIGEQFKSEPLAAPDTTTPTPAADVHEATTNVAAPVAVATTTTTVTIAGATTTSTTTDTATNSISLLCAVCNVSVTSSSQMAMHLEGSKHRKKMRLTAVDSLQAQPLATSIPKMSAVTQVSHIATDKNDTIPPNSILASLKEKGDSNTDLYRTPSGFYYCKACNISMCHETALQQHLQGKKHLKKDAEERARANSKK